jgi:predicted DCC family thiol-disulfide oxidoreductase YuxK
MNPPISENARTEIAPQKRGWIFYDGDCKYCRGLARRFQNTFEPRGFHFVAFQTPWVARETNLPAGERPSEMRVRTCDGRDFGGADAVVFLAGFVCWGKPLRWFATLPGATVFLHRVYRGIAARRSCYDGACELRRA